MLFDVPFLPTAEYCGFISQHKESIHSLHFSLHQDLKLDSRLQEYPFPFKQYLVQLDTIKGVAKYLLFNSRFYHPTTYKDPSLLKKLVTSIELLASMDCLHGLVIADFYFLQALSDFAPEVMSNLEAVPSINCMLDTPIKIQACLDIIETTRFAQPRKIILDRSLNRELDKLEEVNEFRHRFYPQIKLELLANEGCLIQCPFKLTHDAHIALANIGINTETFRLNADFGCIHLLEKQPEQLFKSPFIRPEDMENYERYIDIIKLCGRTLGQDFLMHTCKAYFRGDYQGNLLEILDTLEWLSNRIYIANNELPTDFLEKVTQCSKFCKTCNYCSELFKTHAYDLPLQLKDLRKQN